MLHDGERPNRESVCPTEVEHPTLRLLFRYWDERRGGRSMPSRRDIDPLDIPKLLPHILLIDVSYDPLVFRFRLAGTEITGLFGEEITGKTTEEIQNQRLGRLLRKSYEEVIRVRLPSAKTSTYEGRNRYLRYTRLLLPLSADGEVIDMLLGALVPLSTHHLEPMGKAPHLVQ